MMLHHGFGESPVTGGGTARLRSLLEGWAARAVGAPAAGGSADEGDRRRRACGEILRTVVRPVLDDVMTELLQAGHEAVTRDHTELDNAYPSVALSFTPRTPPPPQFALASALIFRYDPKHGIVVHADVKPSPSRRRVATGAGERHGTMGVDAVSAPWVETKTLNFIEAVLKAN